MRGGCHATDETVSCENVDELNSVNVGLRLEMNVDITDKQDWLVAMRSSTSESSLKNREVELRNQTHGPKMMTRGQC